MNLSEGFAALVPVVLGVLYPILVRGTPDWLTYMFFGISLVVVFLTDPPESEENLKLERWLLAEKRQRDLDDLKGKKR